MHAEQSAADLVPSAAQPTSTSRASPDPYEAVVLFAGYRQMSTQS